MERSPWWELDGHDAYELLGVPEDATRDDIARAHRRKMKLWHTDTSNLAVAEQMSRYLNKAREILEQHRAAYDEHRQRSLAPESAVSDPWEEIPDDDPWDAAETGPPPRTTSPYAPPPHVMQPPPPGSPLRAPALSRFTTQEKIRWGCMILCALWGLAACVAVATGHG